MLKSSCALCTQIISVCSFNCWVLDFLTTAEISDYFFGSKPHYYSFLLSEPQHNLLITPKRLNCVKSTISLPRSSAMLTFNSVECRCTVVLCYMCQTNTQGIELRIKSPCFFSSVFMWCRTVKCNHSCAYVRLSHPKQTQKYTKKP